MGDDLLIRLSGLADARHDDLDVAAEAVTRIISQAWNLNHAKETIEALQSQIDSLQQRVHLCAGYDKLVEENAYLKSELDRLKGFRDGVIEK